jgi:MarR family transcriptional regulator, transcriptional regulator for hemolysin
MPLLVGRPGPQRGLVEAGDRSGGDQGADQRHHLSRQGCRLRQARIPEPDHAVVVGQYVAAGTERHRVDDEGEQVAKAAKAVAGLERVGAARVGAADAVGDLGQLGGMVCSRRTMGGVDVAASPIQGRQVVDVSFLLAHASHVLATRMTAAFAEIGITPREYCVLAHAMCGQYTQIELATIADLDKTTMLNIMDYLERAGYAERTPSPSDRRARIIAVTPDGAKLVAQGDQIADRVHGEVLDALPADQRDVLTSALTTLVTGVLAEPVTSERPVRRPRANTVH